MTGEESSQRTRWRVTLGWLCLAMLTFVVALIVESSGPMILYSTNFRPAAEAILMVNAIAFVGFGLTKLVWEGMKGAGL